MMQVVDDCVCRKPRLMRVSREVHLRQKEMHSKSTSSVVVNQINSVIVNNFIKLLTGNLSFSNRMYKLFDTNVNNGCRSFISVNQCLFVT